MYQKFFTDTIESKFIKSLLYNTPLPIYDSVREGDYLLQDVVYIYSLSVIKCTKSGILGNDAQFTTIKQFQFGQFENQLTQRFKSNYQYYDSDTHKYLGDYLRFYRDIYNIDLMYLYNCFNYRVLEDICLEESSLGYSPYNNPNYKVLCIPIKFNRTYTIAIDCPTKVLMKSVLYGDYGLLKDSADTAKKYVTDSLLEDNETGITILNHTLFNHPCTYKISNTEERFKLKLAQRFQSNERNLYLLIQLPKNNTSSIVVLEGDYRSALMENHYNAEFYSKFTNKDINQIVTSTPSLLRLNTQQTYAFSDRLIEYLLDNVITSQDEIEKNIVRMHEYTNLLSNSNPDKSIFSNLDRLKLFDRYRNANSQMIDMNGFVDKNMEEFITKGIEV